MRDGPERKGNIVNILGDNSFEQICLMLCIYDIHHKMRQESTNMADFLTKFKLEFLSDHNELGINTYIFKKVFILPLKLPSQI